MNENAVQFILASASPRRKELLEKAGWRFIVQPSGVNEEAFDNKGLDSVGHCGTLAMAKAKDVAQKFPHLPVLGADTVVDCGGEIIGKPADAACAERITRLLFSRPHKVVTGLALVWLDRAAGIVRTDITVVYPKMLTDKQVREHIAGGHWRGKAGAYGIQETGEEFVDHIEGSFTNVMGLPMELTEAILADFDLYPNQKAR